MVEIKANSAAVASPAQRGDHTEAAAPFSRTAEQDKKTTSQSLISDSDVKDALEKVNSQLTKVNNSLRFEYHQESNRWL